MKRSQKSIYHFVKFSLHKRSDESEDFVHKPDRVQYMNGLEPDRHAILNILEEPANTICRQSGQVTNSHVMHVEENNISRRTTFRVETRIHGHQQ